MRTAIPVHGNITYDAWTAGVGLKGSWYAVLIHAISNNEQCLCIKNNDVWSFHT